MTPLDGYLVHGRGMLFLWGCSSIIGVLIARYMRHKDWWLYAHVSAQTFAFFCTLPGAAVAAYTSSLYYKDEGVEAQLAGSYNERPNRSVFVKMHIMIGPMITCLTIIQGYLGKYRLHDLALPTPSCRLVTLTRTPEQSDTIGIVHGILGKVLLALAMTQTFTGCSMLFNDKKVMSTFIAFWAMLLCIFAGLELFVLPKHQRLPLPVAFKKAKDIEKGFWQRVRDHAHPRISNLGKSALGSGFDKATNAVDHGISPIHGHSPNAGGASALFELSSEANRESPATSSAAAPEDM